MTTVIFDLNRTLFDPETDDLFPGALQMLEDLKVDVTHLHLLARGEPGRKTLIKRLGLDDVFDSINLVEEKDVPTLSAIMTTESEVMGRIYVVGDHLYDDVRIGNQCGARTIWVRQGQYKNLQPLVPEDAPWATVNNVLEVSKLILP